MNRTNVFALLLGSGISYYTIRRLNQHLHSQQNPGGAAHVPANEPVTQLQLTNEPAVNRMTERGITKELFAYDTSDHTILKHTRFDRQTVDALNQFKLASGVDMSKFVAFSVRHLLNTYPEFKNIINKYLNRTQL